VHYVIKRVGPLRRLWHLILTCVFRMEVTIYKLEHEDAKRDSWLHPFFLCPGCRTYQDWDYGCSDDYPHLCDACWEKKQPCLTTK